VAKPNYLSLPEIELKYSISDLLIILNNANLCAIFCCVIIAGKYNRNANVATILEIGRVIGHAILRAI
jgi:hypothetical protein